MLEHENMPSSRIFTSGIKSSFGLLLCEQVERDYEFYLVIYLQFLAILWVKFGYYKDVL